MRSVGRESHRQSTGKVTVRAGGVRAHSVPESTDALRQTAAATAVSTHGLRTSHRTTVLRPSRRQNSHRDAHQGHAA